MKSTEVGQEGGTNQAKMIKIGAANGCSPPVSNLNTTHNTGMRIRVWSPVQVVPDVSAVIPSSLAFGEHPGLGFRFIYELKDKFN